MITRLREMPWQWWAGTALLVAGAIINGTAAPLYGSGWWWAWWVLVTAGLSLLLWETWQFRRGRRGGRL